MKKVVAVTLNPCVDYTITVPGLQKGKTNLVKSARKDISGKGINVCMQLKNMEQPVIAAGFDFVDGRVRVKDALEKRGISHVLTNVSGSLRTNIKVLDPDTGIMTELNERGSAVREESVQEICHKVCQVMDELDEGSILTVNGSAPVGVPTDTYRRLIEEAKKRKIFTILDASGELLRQGVKAKPELIKPNLDELQELLGRKLETVEEVAEAADELRAQGIPMVCVSMGSRGALLSVKEGCWYAKSATVPIRGLQGAGDAMVAAMAMQILQDATAEYVLRMGMAAANAAIQLEGSLVAGPLEILGMMDAIAIEKLY